MMISVDSNQSSRTPRASTSCTAAMAVASARNPVQSSWAFAALVSGGSASCRPTNASSPTGTSMWNAQRQL